MAAPYLDTQKVTELGKVAKAHFDNWKNALPPTELAALENKKPSHTKH